MNGSFLIPAGVIGPASSTANAIATFSGTTGQFLLNNSVTISAGSITATQAILTGALNAVNVAAGVTPFAELEVDSTLTTSPRGIMTAQFNTGTDGARLHMRKARGTRASPLVVVTGDNLGRIVGTGYDGANYLEMASIYFATEGTIAATRVPTNIQFWTGTNAAPSVLTLAGQFNSSQQLLMGNGTAGAPSYSFTSDTTTGFYHTAANKVGFSGGSALGYEFDGTNQSLNVSSGWTIRNASGTAAAPSYTYSAQTNKGTYNYGTDEIGVALQGAYAFRFSTVGRLFGLEGSNYLQLGSAGAVALAASGTNQSITLTPSGTGRVQLGTTSSGSTTTPLVLSLGGTFGTTIANGMKLAIYDDGGSNQYGLAVIGSQMLFSVPTASTLGFAVGGAEKARFAATGNLLVGGLQTDGTGVLQFPAATTSAGGITFGADVNLFRSAAGVITQDSASTESQYVFSQGASAKGKIETDGGDLRIESLITGKNIKFYTFNSLLALTLDSSQNATFAKLITSYNGIATAGTGVPAIYGSALSGTVTSNQTIKSYTPPATAGRYRISGVITTTSSTNTGTVQFTVDYVDSQGTTHTADIIPLVDAAGAVATTKTGASKEFSMVDRNITINNAATAIVVKTVITGTVSYTADVAIEQLR